MLIELRLLLDPHGICARGGGHAIEPHLTALEHEWAVLPHPRLCDAELPAGNGSGQLTSHNDGMALRQPAKHGMQVSFFDHFEVFVAGRVLCSDDAGASIEEGNALLFQKGDDGIKVVGFLLLSHEVLLVAEEAKSNQAPHVVGEVRVVELHAPAFLGRWKRTQHQYPCIGWQKRFKGMNLHFPIAL